MSKIKIEIDGTDIVEAVTKDVADGLNDHVATMVDTAVNDAVDSLDFEMLVRDYGCVDTAVEDYVYNNDIVDKCWVEDELNKVHRDIRDEVLADIRDEIDHTVALTNDVAILQSLVMGQAAEIDFLHEKYQELFNKSLAGRMLTITEWFSKLVRRVHWHMPRR